VQEGSFAFVFKSTHFPDEIVATRRGSPLLIGVKTDRKLKVDFVDVEVHNEEQRGKSNQSEIWLTSVEEQHVPSGLLTVPTAPSNGNQTPVGPKLRRSQSRAFMSEDGMPQPIEFFVASDASAVIEHTKRVLYLEDDDIAHIAEGGESPCVNWIIRKC
jgi:glucosamine--fructose-6-phosphate aminotransferase (isomerizing)